MKLVPFIKVQICFLLLMFCAMNSGFAIYSNQIDPGYLYNFGSEGSGIANNLYTQKAQMHKETKVSNRSERLIKKLVQKTYKTHRPGNGKQMGWYVFGIIIGIGLLTGAVLSFFLYGFIKSEGATGAGWMLGIGFICVFLFGFIFADLLRWDKKYPGNSVKSGSLQITFR